MNITIHRGTDQIGGCVTEYELDGWRLFVDYGEQLPGAPKTDKVLEIEGLTKGDVSKSALLLTHYHGDHVGKIAELPEELPVFMGRLACDILGILCKHLSSVDKDKERLTERLKTVKTFSPGIQFEFGKFSIKPVTVDHSAFDAYAFRIEGEGVSVFHTGDFRTHGFRSGKFPKLIKGYVGKVDYVVTEATNVSRSDATAKSEYEVQKEFEEAFRANKNNAVFLSSTNVDRLFSLYQAALRAGRPFYVDHYQKEIMDAVVNSDSIWMKSRLYKYGKHEPMTLKWDKVSGKGFMINDKFQDFLDDKGCVLISRSNENFIHLIDKIPGEVVKYLSMWRGYVDESSEAYSPQLAEILGQDYRYIHTSGHCDMESLEELFELVSPKAIIPIHTDAPQAFAKRFSDRWPIMLLKDGEVFSPISFRLIDSVTVNIIAKTAPHDDIEVVANETDAQWWSADIKQIGAFRSIEDAKLALQRVRYATDRLVGYSIEEEEDMSPWHHLTFSAKLQPIAEYRYGDHAPGEKQFQQIMPFKVGEQVLAVTTGVMLPEVVVPCEVLGSVTKDLMWSMIKSDICCPYDSWEECADTLSDWDWDMVAVRPKVLLKSGLDELRQTQLMQRMYLFPNQ